MVFGRAWTLGRRQNRWAVGELPRPVPDKDNKTKPADRQIRQRRTAQLQGAL